MNLPPGICAIPRVRRRFGRATGSGSTFSTAGLDGREAAQQDDEASEDIGDSSMHSRFGRRRGL